MVGADRQRFNPAKRAANVPVQPTGMPRPGEADNVDFVNKVVTNLKSARASVYESWGRNGVYKDYWNQLEVYALGLARSTAATGQCASWRSNRETGRALRVRACRQPGGGSGAGGQGHEAARET